MAVYGGDDFGAARSAALSMPMRETAHGLVPINPWAMDDDLEGMIAFLGRYMHLDPEVAERQSLSRLRGWYQRTREYVLAEHGKKPDGSDHGAEEADDYWA